ncbi:Histidine kinase [Pseudodesulfovibrio profundus]|uniref:histidine kinase n=1 Tax=Pseudodesulfovibrio profundus TaxID=57320 RepID=A0A2C8F7N7_9BACT|nr:response regulator [Pseudodesulfovibrio profundus]SOB58768.1 Histidine kinase [Pseudodesulfovibrio profundus]
MKGDLILGSIRKKLVYLVLLATLPVFLVLLFNEFEKRRSEVAAAQNNASIFLRGFSEVQQRITESTRTLLRTVSQLPEVKSGNPEVVQQVLATLLRANPMYTNVIMVDLEGNVVAMGRGKDNGFNFSDRKQFRDAIAFKRFSYGEFVVGKQSKKFIFPFGIPVLDENGEPVSAIIIGVELNHYQRHFDKSKFPAGTFFGMCDHNGYRIFRYPNHSELEIGKPIKQDVYQVASNSGQPGIIETATSNGRDTIIAYEPLRIDGDNEPYMYMFMGLDKEKVLESANDNLLQGGIVSFFSLCIALTFAWLLGRQTIASKIDQLTLAAQKIGQGDRAVSSGLDYNDGELGQLAESFDTMSVLLKKREEDLSEAKETAESANIAKDEFLANISHEVRTPLNGVMGMLQLLDETDMNQEQHVFVDTALQSSRNLLRVLNDLLDFIKMGSGKLELYEEPFELEELVEESTSLFKLQLEQKGIVVESHVDENAKGLFVADIGRIRQVVFNLLGNAIKFTHEGKILLEVFTLPHPKKDKDRLFFLIEDTGVGIPSNKLEYVFDAFTQVDGSLSREYQGAGLGLPIVKKLVHLMNGNCVIESEVGVGTTVLFCVEVSRIEKPVETRDHVESTGSMQALDILLVEDERVNRIMAERLLKKMGHTVYSAVNGSDCLSKLRTVDVDVILMDVQMPVLDGLAATRIIRTNSDYAEFSNIPIIGLSAHAAEQSRQEALSAGMDLYVAKPFTKEDLEKAFVAIGDR